MWRSTCMSTSASPKRSDMQPETSTPVSTALASVESGPAFKFYQEHTAVPDELRTKALPPVHGLANLFFNKLLPACHLKWVKVEEFVHDDGRTYVRVRVGVPGRSHVWVTTLFGLYMIGKAMHFMLKVGMLDRLPSDEVGVSDNQSVAIPTWAAVEALTHFSGVLRRHHYDVQFLLEEFHRLSVEEMPEEEKPSPPVDESVPQQRTLH